MAPTEEHLFDWGNNLLQLQAFEDATKVFTPAIARHPRSAAAVRRPRDCAVLARPVRRRRQVVSVRRAIWRRPIRAPISFLGEMYGVAPAIGEEITRRLARFAKAQPRNAQAQFHYAMSLWKGQPAGSPSPDLRQVEGLLRRAVTLDVKFAKAFLELGILLSDQQRYTEAIQELRHATRLAPDLAQAHYRLSQAYQRTGQEELAAKELELFRRSVV
jgi:tetratricopeptide (TPR) repeat protein